MSLRLAAMAWTAPVAMAAMAAPAMAQTPPHSAAFERAILGEMNPPTRGAVQKRATAGNTVSGVIATILLNNFQRAHPGNAGKALSVTAIDFVRGVVVIRIGPNQYAPVRFDPKTLHVTS